ncbi:phosphate ABC transporter substrate-binding protein [Pyramidobacter sp. SM-530-WT-4B]|uniref:Phosphate ABC transporter substrate-binding protein n=1 Tax=Pyramidobacter porci TaxID=2605789 RepID=A0A6L5YDA0_9BACT|nr:substrate-binding domain-containing protein [Pyramidobacter porci]MST56135.1 phosphate ABC transporter substrate-binding protein [Pyramidobacter porci]
MSMKKLAAVVLAMSVSCAAPAFAVAKGGIDVISREEGSGTRGAFIELFGVEQKDTDGKKVDMTTDNADITNSTSVMMTMVAGNPNAIGYASMGSLKKADVKALAISGAAATAENIRKGDYKIARPFNVAAKGQLRPAAQAFLNFVMSAQGQKVIVDNGYVAVNEKAAPFAAKRVAGKVVAAGSSSIAPIMEKLKEAYLLVNPAAEIEVQTSDSTTGMTSAISGICDLGMASRGLKESELKAGLTPVAIAMDGIAVIVNKGNELKGLTVEQVRDIYTGKIENWETLK